MVKRWRDVLDPELQHLQPPDVKVEPIYDSPPQQQQDATNLAPQVEDDDEDLHADLGRSRIPKSLPRDTKATLRDNISADTSIDEMSNLNIHGKDVKPQTSPVKQDTGDV